MMYGQKNIKICVCVRVCVLGHVLGIRVFRFESLFMSYL